MAQQTVGEGGGSTYLKDKEEQEKREKEAAQAAAKAVAIVAKIGGEAARPQEASSPTAGPVFSPFPGNDLFGNSNFQTYFSLGPSAQSGMFQNDFSQGNLLSGGLPDSNLQQKSQLEESAGALEDQKEETLRGQGSHLNALGANMRAKNAEKEKAESQLQLLSQENERLGEEINVESFDEYSRIKFDQWYTSRGTEPGGPIARGANVLTPVTETEFYRKQDRLGELEAQYQENATDENWKKVEELTAELERDSQYLNELYEEYQEKNNQYGENYDEVQRLQWNVINLTAQCEEAEKEFENYAVDYPTLGIGEDGVGLDADTAENYKEWRCRTMDQGYEQQCNPYQIDFANNELEQMKVELDKTEKEGERIQELLEEHDYDQDYSGTGFQNEEEAVERLHDLLALSEELRAAIDSGKNAEYYYNIKVQVQEYEEAAENDPDFLEIGMRKREELSKSRTGSGFSRWDYMSPNEKLVIAYYAVKDPEKAEAYNEVLEGKLDYRRKEKNVESVKDISESCVPAGVLINLGSYVLSPLAYAEVIRQGIENKITGTYKPVNLNSEFMYGPAFETASREGITESTDNPFVKWALNGALDLAQTSLSSMMGGAGVVINATSEAGKAAYQAIERGASPEQAATIGTVSGALEYALDKIPMDELTRISRGRKNAGGIVKDILKEAGMGGVEGTAGEFGKTLLDNLVMGDLSEMSLYAKSLEEQGMSREEAEREAKIKFFVRDPIQAGIENSLDRAGSAIAGKFQEAIGNQAHRFQEDVRGADDLQRQRLFDETEGTKRTVSEDQNHGTDGSEALQARALPKGEGQTDSEGNLRRADGLEASEVRRTLPDDEGQAVLKGKMRTDPLETAETGRLFDGGIDAAEDGRFFVADGDTAEGRRRILPANEAESGEPGRNVPEGGRYEDISQSALDILKERGVKEALEKAAKEQLEEVGLWEDLKRGELKSSGGTLTAEEVESRLAGEYAGKEFFQSERGIQRLIKQDPALALEIENTFLEMAERTQDPGQRAELLKTAGKYDRAMGEVSGEPGTEYSTESGRAREDLRQEKGELELLPEEGTSLGEKTTNASTDDVKNIDNLKPVEYYQNQENDFDNVTDSLDEKEQLKKRRGEQLERNKEQGSTYARKEFSECKRSMGDLVDEITIVTTRGTRFRADAMGTNPTTGEIVILEFKSSQTARLTKNQKIGFKELYESGGKIVGKGKGKFHGGMEIPSGTEVKIRKPKEGENYVNNIGRRQAGWDRDRKWNRETDASLV